MGYIGIAVNRFTLFIKLVPLDPDTEKAMVNPCEIEPQLGVHLNEYMDTYRFAQMNMRELGKAIEQLLDKFWQVFDCPIGWTVQMESFDIDLLSQSAQDLGFKENPEKLYYPPHGATEVDISFLKDWVMEPFKHDHQAPEIG